MISTLASGALFASICRQCINNVYDINNIHLISQLVSTPPSCIGYLSLTVSSYLYNSSMSSVGRLCISRFARVVPRGQDVQLHTPHPCHHHRFPFPFPLAFPPPPSSLIPSTNALSTASKPSFRRESSITSSIVIVFLPACLAKDSRS